MRKMRVASNTPDNRSSGTQISLTWVNTSSSTTCNSSLTMAKEWVVVATANTNNINTVGANTPEEDITRPAEVDLPTVEGETVVAAVEAVVDVVVLETSPTGLTRHSSPRARSI